MTATDPTYAGLLAGVLATPEDDVPRLVLADWLEENGEPKRAEFIRVQVELARLDHAGPLPTADDCRCPRCRKAKPIRRRERELLRDYGRDWFTDLPRANTINWNQAPDRVTLPGPDFAQVAVRRGFVESVSCDLATFLDIAPRLFASQPVRQITLSDVRPMRHRILAGHRYGYELRDDNARDAWQLPAELWRHLPKADFFVNDYRRWWWTEENALDALSTALVAYGRANAEGHSHEAVCESRSRT